ncbi:DUF2971 domain-containing protein [Flavobacterium sp. FBOR7N2.3]|uniref:DUF2971 domain-containing protein n=1 Tax=Flavobacterium magnesitis TaxID=3138077 RepID=A0ABV4TI39_9FLAO
MEKYNFNGFTYVKDYKYSGFSIEHNKEKPEHIFKFYALNKFSVDALLKGYFYASHPIELNDSLDSSRFLMYTSQKLGIDFYERLIEDSLTKQEITELYNKDINNENLCSWYITTHYDISTNLFGIISTTAKENNILMWPHYTQESGFQIKLNTQKLEKSIENKLTQEEQYLGFYPINYCEKLIPIDISSYDQMFIPLAYVTNVKSNKWSYEEEWRFIIGKQNMGVPYTKSGLNPHKDYFVRTENRYVFYDSKLIEEITVAHNFFNARQFEVKWLDAKNVLVKPIEESNWEYQSQVDFLNYIVENLSDKFYHSGTKYEIDKDGVTILIRTKEKMEIKKEIDETFILTRTDDYKIFMD